MAAYVIGLLRVKDWNWYREYRKVVEPLVAKHGGKYLVKGGEPSYLEGEQRPPDAVVVIEFASSEHVARFYADPEYAPVIALRQGGAATELLSVEGV